MEKFYLAWGYIYYDVIMRFCQGGVKSQFKYENTFAAG